MSLWSTIEAQLAAATGRHVALKPQGSVGGGCISQAMRLSGEGQDYFVKTNTAARLPMFEAEALGLRALAAAQALRVPEAVCWGCHDDTSFLVLAYLALGGKGDTTALGRGLAQLHHCTRADYGWDRDNTIGSTPQINRPDSNWVTFFQIHRLKFQLDLAARNGHGGRLQTDGERLLADLHGFFDELQPPASLLHGDLWSGNYSFTSDGEPVIFDPAVYYGDREADIAMTELFGGFGARFYAAYNDAWPLDPGYRVRKTLYNLYHVLNHLNLFGGGYRSQAQGMIEDLLSELR